jgi:flagella basal body P-ring formation protein FlgA
MRRFAFCLSLFLTALWLGGAQAAQQFRPPHPESAAPQETAHAAAAPTPAATPQPAQEAAIEPGASYSVTLSDAEKMIGDALIAKGAGTQLHVVLYGKRGAVLSRSDALIKTEVSGLQYDPGSGRLSALLLFQANGVNLTPVRVSGRYESLVSVPMLTHTVENGEKITQADLTMTAYGMRRLHKGTVMDVSGIIGKTPLRAIGPGRPIRMDELTTPADVKKGQQVTLSYQTGGMEIHTVGEALQSATIGSRIEVRNTASHIVVSGTLKDANTVVVSSLDK